MLVKRIQPLVLFLILLQLIFSSCQKTALESPIYIVDSTKAQSAFSLESMNATFYNDLFTRYGNGWTGGDATYSVPLPDGRVVWIFGNTFLDTVYANRTRPYSNMIKNSFMVQDGSNFTTLYGGTTSDPVSLIDTADPNQWFWPLDGTVSGDTLYVFFSLYHQIGNGAFDYTYVRTDLMAFSLPSLSLRSTQTVSTNLSIRYGTCVYEDGNYLYIFGDEKNSFTNYVHVARVLLSNLRGAWEYWDGEDWTSAPPEISIGRIIKGNQPIEVSPEFSVFYADGKYRLVTHQDLFGKKIFSYESNSITGPWSNKNTVYTTPETGGNIWTYNAFVHPEFDSAGFHLLSYNINSLNPNDLFTNADNYRPKFIWYKYY